jgi:hypothetical protein
MLAAAWGDYTKSQCSAGSDRLVSQPVETVEKGPREIGVADVW